MEAFKHELNMFNRVKSEMKLSDIIYFLAFAEIQLFIDAQSPILQPFVIKQKWKDFFGNNKRNPLI
jgi:hypothetical protein